MGGPDPQDPPPGSAYELVITLLFHKIIDHFRYDSIFPSTGVSPNHGGGVMMNGRLRKRLISCFKKKDPPE